MSETAFLEQLQRVREAWDWSRHLARLRQITSRPRWWVYAEADVAAQRVLGAIERLRALAATDAQQRIVAEADRRYGRVVREGIASRQPPRPTWVVN